jgi:N-acetylmuramoyl-L-alanine amidase
LTEKEVNLQAALELARLLEKRGAQTILTRSTDITLGLEDRVARAEAANADLLISLHHNALPDGVNPFGAYGTGTHYYRPQSRALALAVQREVARELELPDEGIYYHNLALVRPPAMPAVLLEAAYIMLPEQEALLRQKDYPTRLAAAVTRGVAAFMREQTH